MISFTRFFGVAVLASFLCSVTSVATAQEKKITGYVLYKVLTGQETGQIKPKAPRLIEADASGGRAVVEIDFGRECREVSTFSWKFNRDIRFLRPNQEFTVTTTVGVSGDCASNPFAIVSGLGPSIRARLSPEERNARRVTLISEPNTEATLRIYGKAGANRVSAGSDRFATRGNLRGAPFLCLGLHFCTGSARESYYGRVAYLFRAVYGNTPPGDVPIELDNPRPNSSNTARIPPPNTPTDPPTDVTRVPPTPTPDTGGDPCLDPAVQKCIDQWLDELVASLNQNWPELAPWSISRYGHLVNRQTVSVQAPDEWETKYRSSKSCYVWANYANEHRLPVHGGELPALADYVVACNGGQGGGTTSRNPPPPVDAAVRTLMAAKRIVREGQRVLVPVYLLRPDGVANMNFTVTYDASVVEPDGQVVKGNLLSGTRLETNSGSLGIIRVGFARTTSLNSDGIVINLPFRVIGTAGQRTQLTLAVSDIDDPSGNPLPIRLVDGEIIIQGPGQGTRGDCDGDGVLTVADAICALKMSVELMPVDSNLDINGDGQVTSADAREILQRMP